MLGRNANTLTHTATLECTHFLFPTLATWVRASLWAVQTARHTSVDFGELELHCLPIWKEGQRDWRIDMSCWGRWEWLADFCELRSSKSPERTLPTCKGASCNQVLETDVEILGDDGASLQSVCPTCAHHVLSCGETVNISPQSVFVEWIKKLTFWLGALCSWRPKHQLCLNLGENMD